MSGIVLGVGDISMNKIDKDPHLLKIDVLLTNV